MEQQMYNGLIRLYRVYCLSEVCDSPLMWAHYTDSHTGICLDFDALAAPFTQQNGATKVSYRATYPAFDMTARGAGYKFSFRSPMSGAMSTNGGSSLRSAELLVRRKPSRPTTTF